MFESIRSHRRWLMPLLIVAVFLPFVFSGIYGFTRFISDDNSVARIDGEPVSQQEFENAHREWMERTMQMLGQNVDARLLDTPQMRANNLDKLLSDKALDHEASRLRLGGSDEHIRELIASVPQFQVDGKFDYDTYIRLLTMRGFTQASFEARLFSDAARQTLAQGVTAGAILPRAVLERIHAIDAERREVRRLVLRPDDFLAKATVADEAIKADYDNNQDAYRTAEHAKVEFLALRMEDLAARASVTEAAEKAFYDANKSRWAGVEQRKASHILITAGKDGSAPDKAAARKMAEEILRQVRAHPGDFAKIAREKSKDPGSAANGGDLGWFGRAMMTKPFEDAAFALKEGQISDVVETDFGFHVIQVTGVKGTSAQPFEEVRATIDAELRKQAAQKSYAELADQFTNFVYEQSDGLAAAAAKFNLPLQTVESLGRSGVAQQPDKAKYFPAAVLDAVFAADSLEKHRNTKAIDIGSNTLVSARVVAYTPAAVRPFEEVRTAIRSKLERASASKLAKDAAQARLAQLRQQADDTGFEAPHELSRRDTNYLPAAAINAAMSLPADKLPSYVGADQPDGSYVILHVLGMSSAPAAADTAAQDRSWSERVANAEQYEYVQALRERFDAKVTRTDLSSPKAAPRKP
jgi:peptidyl-prolyl cis-trans isomerase D